MNSFPPPTDQAIEAGILGEEDCDIQSLRALHDEHVAEALGTLSDTDTVMDARRRGVDPRNGKPPRNEAAQQALTTFYGKELNRLEHRFADMMGAYEDAFGDEAADAFEKMLRARYAGVPVVANNPRVGPPVSPPSAPIAEVPTPSPASLAVTLAPPPSKRPRVSTVLPVPKPLAAAVAAGHFGQEDDGTPVRPTPDEVRAITQDQAEKLVDLLGSSDTPTEPFNALLQAYAEDFGEKAAGRLGAHAQKEFRERYEVH